MNFPTDYFNRYYFLTDGGMETTLVFHEGFTLRPFSAFELLNDEAAKQVLRNYYLGYMDLAGKYGMGFILGMPTWRASSDWGVKLGYSHDELRALNKQAVHFARSLAEERTTAEVPIIISGEIGPRGDGYRAENCITREQAKAYHFDQVQTFAMADVDMVTALTLNYSDEAIGIVQATKAFHIPIAVSFTVETDGRLPNGETLKDAITETDAATDSYASYFMINCAHPQHFTHVFEDKGQWISRIKGIRANASIKSHAELDESETLDTGDKALLAEGYSRLSQLLPELKIIGGCCGTDHSHLECICESLFPQQASEVKNWPTLKSFIQFLTLKNSSYEI